MTIYALLVGINRYQKKTINQLHGCENDVNHVAATLTKRYAIPAENCLKLLSEEATKANIIAGFQQHLGKAGEGDTAIFYFSGHGSEEAIDPRLWCIAPNKHSETLVCHDSRVNEPYDLADKELRYLIHQISQRKAKVVTIIDSCHSGDATRDLDDEGQSGVRQSPAGDSIRPLESYVFFHDPAAQDWLQDFNRMPEGEHIAISACRNDQLSKEVFIQGGKHGAFTHAFCQSLEHVLVPPSYRNLVDAAGQRVKALVRLQNPQLDYVGALDIHSTFLESGMQPVVYQVDFMDGEWWINAGLPQGINVNARLQINEGEKAIQLKVLEALHDKSRVLVEGPQSLDTRLHYAAHMLDPAIPKLPVAFEGDSSLVSALQQTLGQGDDRYYLEESATPEYLLKTSEQAITLTRSNHASLKVDMTDPQTGMRHPMPLPLAIDPVDRRMGLLSPEQIALKLVTHMAKWQRTLNIVYTTGYMPENLMEVVIEQYDPVTQQYTKLNSIDDSFEMYYQQTPDGGVFAPRFKLSLELNTRIPWDEDVYVSLLHMDPVTGGITPMTTAKGEIFRQQDKTVFDGASPVAQRARSHYQFTKRDGNPEINASVSDELLQMGINQTTDYLKLFISNFELDVSNLGLPSLKRYLQALYQDAYRSFDLEEYKPVHRARTKTIALSTIKHTF